MSLLPSDPACAPAFAEYCIWLLSQGFCDEHDLALRLMRPGSAEAGSCLPIYGAVSRLACSLRREHGCASAADATAQALASANNDPVGSPASELGRVARLAGNDRLAFLFAAFCLHKAGLDAWAGPLSELACAQNGAEFARLNPPAAE